MPMLVPPIEGAASPPPAYAACKLQSAIFVSAATLVTGLQSGELLMWDVTGTRSAKGSMGCAIKVRMRAHGMESLSRAPNQEQTRRASPAGQEPNHTS